MNQEICFTMSSLQPHLLHRIIFLNSIDYPVYSSLQWCIKAFYSLLYQQYISSKKLTWQRSVPPTSAESGLLLHKQLSGLIPGFIFSCLTNVPSRVLGDLVFLNGVISCFPSLNTVFYLFKWIGWTSAMFLKLCLFPELNYLQAMAPAFKSNTRLTVSVRFKDLDRNIKKRCIDNLNKLISYKF